MHDRNEEGLIVDDGEIRECDSNIAKMGLVRTWWHFHGYKSCLNQLAGEYEDAVEALKVLAYAAAFLLLMPILPFVQAFFGWRRAVKACRREK